MCYESFITLDQLNCHMNLSKCNFPLTDVENVFLTHRSEENKEVKAGVVFVANAIRSTSNVDLFMKRP